ncbi:28386_t:CDS:2, partial [Gigaspora margarita]
RDNLLRVFINKLKDPDHSNAVFKGLYYFLFSFSDSLKKGLQRASSYGYMKDSQNINKLLGQILPFLNDYLLITADSMDNFLKEIGQVRADAQSLKRGMKTV